MTKFIQANLDVVQVRDGKGAAEICLKGTKGSASKAPATAPSRHLNAVTELSQEQLLGLITAALADSGSRRLSRGQPG